ncbi:hypothetical protein NKG94_06280 [Micromonospora sp. M12]
MDPHDGHQALEQQPGRSQRLPGLRRTLAGRPKAEGWTSWEGGNTGPTPELRVAADGTVPLESGWSLTMDDFAGTADGAELSRAGVDVRSWLAATVPGTVLGTLVDQGHLPDPVAGFNNMRIPEALSRHTWWYRRAAVAARPGHLGRSTDLARIRRHQPRGDRLGQRRAGRQRRAPFARAAFDITDALAGHRANTSSPSGSPRCHTRAPRRQGPGRSYLPPVGTPLP